MKTEDEDFSDFTIVESCVKRISALCAELQREIREASKRRASK